MVSIMTLVTFCCGRLLGAAKAALEGSIALTRLPWQRRLTVRFFVNFLFSASMNVRTRGVQAVSTIGETVRKGKEESFETSERGINRKSRQSVTWLIMRSLTRYIRGYGRIVYYRD
jgi:hypothetical protein